MNIGFKWFNDGVIPAANWTGSGGVNSITLDVLICDAPNPAYESYSKDDGKANYDGQAWNYGRTRYHVTIQFGAKIYAANAAAINQMIASHNIQIYDTRRSWLGSTATITFVKSGDVVPVRKQNSNVLEDVVLQLTASAV